MKRCNLIALLRILRRQIQLKLTITNLIPCLVFTIMLTRLLNRIISEMNIFIFQIFCGKKIRRCSEVTLFVKKEFKTTVYTQGQKISTNIEFSTLVKENILHVSLYNQLPLHWQSRNYLFYISRQKYLTPSVRILRRLHDPHPILSSISSSLKMLHRSLISFRKIVCSWNNSLNIRFQILKVEP